MTARLHQTKAARDGRRRRPALLRLPVLALVLPLTACAVGPDFVPPSAPHAQRYTARPTPTSIRSTRRQGDQEIRLGHSISDTWWTVYKAPALDVVLKQAIADSPTLTAARATLAQAREGVAVAAGGLYPQLDLGARAARQRGTASGVTGTSVGNLYSLSADAGYSLDVFGGIRRNVEQQRALADVSRYELAAAWLTLTGQSVSQALTIASTSAQIRAVREIIDADGRNLALVREKYQAGKAARVDVITAETSLASDQILLPPLQQQRDTARHALTMLIGHTPGEWSPPAFRLHDFTLPPQVPLSLPSSLVRQRPDILAAEARLHAASAAIGVATANLYPSFTLSASLGQQSGATGTLFDSASRFWNLALSPLQPLFHGGALRADKRAAVDAYRASLASYRQTVLTGFQQVSDSLRALSHDAELIDAQTTLLDNASSSLELQRISYRAGKSDLLQLLDAQRSYARARLGYIQASTQRLQDTASLIVAMGGGWWHSAAAGATDAASAAR
ncbi:MAG TPA: efflux transporter outer membrane subunit [Gammaproteobacteria bacterium]|nr:efflux transporter outer membrane subunit [Gammaproteobacteria bacterium]